MKFFGNFIITTSAALLGAFLPTALWVAFDGAAPGWILAIGAGAFLFTFVGTFMLAVIQMLLRAKHASQRTIIVATLLAGFVLGGLMLSYSSRQGMLMGSIYGIITAGILLGLQYSHIGSLLAVRPVVKKKRPEA